MENTTDLLKNCISYWKSWFSIAMLVYLRVSRFSHPTGFHLNSAASEASNRSNKSHPARSNKRLPLSPGHLCTHGRESTRNTPKDRVHHGWNSSKKNGTPFEREMNHLPVPIFFFKYVRLSRSFQGMLPSGKKCFLTFAVEKKFLGKEYPVSAIRHEI